MKKLLLLLTITILSTYSLANTCDNLQTIAIAVMNTAQSRVDKEAVIREANKNNLSIEQMINDAYSYPIIRDQLGKKVISDLFGRLYYASCMGSGVEI